MKQSIRFLPFLAGGFLLGSCTVSPAELFSNALLAGIADAIALTLSGVLLGTFGVTT